MARGGGVKFAANQEQSEALGGYIMGMAQEIETDKHIGAVVGYVQSELSKAFGMALDVAAHNAPEYFHHVYEWGDSYQDYSRVGIPTSRLWFLTSVGNGANRVMSYAFKPSVKPVPINPILAGKGVKSGIHVFTWKAPVLEYGMTVRIRRMPGTKKLVYVNDHGQIVFADGPITAKHNKDKTYRMFTNFFVSWWASEANTIYNGGLRQEIEQDLVNPGRFAAAIRRYKTKTKQFTINTNYAGEKNFIQARKQARLDMKKDERKYRAEAQQRRFDKYGY